MALEENVKPLKMLVISLGLMLIGGTLLLAVGIWHKLFEAPETAASACPGGKADLTGRGRIVDSVVEGRVVRVILEKDGGDEIVTIDLCSGEILGSLSIAADAPGSYNKDCDKTIDYKIKL